MSCCGCLRIEIYSQAGHAIISFRIYKGKGFQNSRLSYLALIPGWQSVVLGFSPSAPLDCEILSISPLISPAFHPFRFLSAKNLMALMARVAQWWEHSPPTNVARVQITASTPYVGWVCCWFSPLLQEVFLRVLQFSPFLKNQYFQIPIRPGIR